MKTDKRDIERQMMRFEQARWLLSDLDLITTLGPHRERTRFDAGLGRHHHFVCRRYKV